MSPKSCHFQKVGLLYCAVSFVQYLARTNVNIFKMYWISWKNLSMYGSFHYLISFQTEVDATKYDSLGKFDETVLSSLGEFGAYGLQAPEQYNGAGLTFSEYARLVGVIGKCDLALGTHLGAHQGIGYKGIVMYGTEEQKAKYLPDLAAGKKFAAYCLTEPDTGSDASSIQTKAELSSDEKHYVLNGTKVWITNGGLADVFTVFAKVPVTDKDGQIKQKMTAFIVERSFGGVTHSEPEKKMGINASNTVTLYFEDCKVPVENVLGQIGDGFKVAVTILNQGRFAMAAALSGTMFAAIKQTTQHVLQRKQFGKTLNEYQSVQEKLTNMVLRHYVSESMAFMLSGTMDLGAKDFQVEAAISKVYSSEAAWYCVDEAIQLHGGAGFMKHTNLERVLRDLRVFRIFEGANDVLRLFIALTGLNFAGKHLTALTRSPIGMLGLVMNKLRGTLGVSGEGASLVASVSPQLSDAARLTGQAIDSFGDASLYLLTNYGKGVINEQFRLVRLADAAIHLYGMVCALSRATNTIGEHPQLAGHEITLARLVCYQGFKTIKRCLSELDKSEDRKMFDLMKSISFDVCNHGGVVYRSPLGL
ncbi:very long chain acyl-CoA dehydrogenase [Paragonimus westermani]|uniref:Very long chain acyl-CoA dehydrogenase n=1 Tax=Paragonimus westermani TaxID=34504 RepID=A0A5J4NTH9_9TREM|nr:very long chain acyl-CoA dehydrogenase [Paragonimus westermani]